MSSYEDRTVLEELKEALGYSIEDQVELRGTVPLVGISQFVERGTSIDHGSIELEVDGIQTQRTYKGPYRSDWSWASPPIRRGEDYCIIETRPSEPGTIKWPPDAAGLQFRLRFRLLTMKGEYERDERIGKRVRFVQETKELPCKVCGEKTNNFSSDGITIHVCQECFVCGCGGMPQAEFIERKEMTYAWRCQACNEIFKNSADFSKSRVTKGGPVDLSRFEFLDD